MIVKKIFSIHSTTITSTMHLHHMRGEILVISTAWLCTWLAAAVAGSSVFYERGYFQPREENLQPLSWLQIFSQIFKSLRDWHLSSLNNITWNTSNMTVLLYSKGFHQSSPHYAERRQFLINFQPREENLQPFSWL